MFPEIIKIKSCAIGVALFFTGPAMCLPNDSLRKKCVCEIYQGIAEREYRESLRIHEQNFSKVNLKRKKNFDFRSGSSPSRKKSRRKLKKDRISRCWN
jgi:hypothetical protein